jgi:hypothetical protein
MRLQHLTKKLRQSLMTRSGQRNVWRQGTFGIFTVKIMSGDNIGHESKGIRSENFMPTVQAVTVQTVTAQIVTVQLRRK